MDRVTAAGVLCTGLALAGYAAGLATPYPGRGLTLAGVLVGLTLLLVGGAGR